MIDNIEKLKESLVSTLIEKTEKYEVEWKWFKVDDKEELEKKHIFAYSKRPKRLFPYNIDAVSEEFPETYVIVAEESMFVKIKYYEKEKNGNEYLKGKLRYGLIKGYNSDSDDGEAMLSLVCDRKDSKFYVPIITSNSSEECHKKLEELYYLAEFKMHSEMKLIEKWMNGEFEKIEKEIKEEKEAKKLKKKEEKEAKKIEKNENKFQK